MTGCGHPHLTWLGLIWSSPASLIGIAFAFLSGAIPRMYGRSDQLIAESQRGLARLFLLERGYAAITFGCVMVAAIPLTPQLLMHEGHHTYQYGRLGLFFLPVYLWLNITHGYASNPFELEAVACALGAN